MANRDNFSYVPVNKNRERIMPIPSDGIPQGTIRVGGGFNEYSIECDGHEPRPDEYRTSYRFIDGKTVRFNRCKICGRMVEKASVTKPTEPIR